MNDFIQRVFAWFPVSIIGILAVIVMTAWILGGVGGRTSRLAIGVPWMGVLIASWSLLLYVPDTPDTTQLVVGSMAVVTTLGSFAIPWLWRRVGLNHIGRS